MNRIRYVLFASFGLSFALAAQADMQLTPKTDYVSKISPKHGGLVGNGGGTVVCRDGNHKIKSVELLDFYEARTLRNVKIDLDSMSGDWKSKAEAVVARLSSQTQLRNKLYSDWLSKFDAESKILTDVQFSTVPDSGYIGVPSGCEFEQAIIQRKPIFDGDSRYYINSEIWSAMDESQKAGLVLHELIYREAIAYGHTDSIRSRYLTALYSSASFESLASTDYRKILQQARFEITDVPTAPFLTGDVKTTLDLKRLGQVENIEPFGNGPLLELKDRLVIRLGQCKQGCDEYYPDANSLIYDSSLVGSQVALAEDIHEMKIGDNDLYEDNSGFVLKPDGSMSSFMRNGFQDVLFYTTNDSSSSADAITRIGLDAYAENSFTSELAIPNETMKHLAWGVHELNLVKTSNGKWLWSSIQATELVRGETEISQGSPGNSPVVELNFFLEAGNECVKASVTYDEKARANFVSAAASYAPKCTSTSNGYFAYVSSVFANGEAKFVLNAKLGETLKLDPAQEQPFILGAQDFSRWSASNLLLSCSFNTIPENCMKFFYGANRTVSHITISGEGADFAFGDRVPDPMTTAAVRSVQAHVKAGSMVELYSNGMVKSFVNDKPLTGFSNGVSISIPANSFVTLDANAQYVPAKH